MIAGTVNVYVDASSEIVIPAEEASVEVPPLDVTDIHFHVPSTLAALTVALPLLAVVLPLPPLKQPASNNATADKPMLRFTILAKLNLSSIIFPLV